MGILKVGILSFLSAKSLFLSWSFLGSFFLEPFGLVGWLVGFVFGGILVSRGMDVMLNAGTHAHHSIVNGAWAAGILLAVYCLLLTRSLTRLLKSWCV